MLERELTFEDYIGMLRRRWPLILILAVVGAPLAYGVSRYLPNRYKSQTLVMVEQPTVSTDYVRPVSNRVYERAAPRHEAGDSEPRGP